MKLLLVISILVLGPSTSTSSPETLGYTKVCQELEGPLSQTGQCNTLNESIPRLATLQINDKINSIHQSGAWIYYEHVNYNNQPGPGRVWYVFDDDLSIALPPVLRSRVSSIRYLGKEPYEDSLRLYSGIAFTGLEQVVYPDDSSFFLEEQQKFSSLIVTGLSPWTLFTGERYTGDSICVLPHTDSEIGLFRVWENSPVHKLGIYPNPTTHGIPDTIKSAKRGCSSTAIAMPQLLTKTGLWEDGYWKDEVDFLSSYVAEDVSE